MIRTITGLFDTLGDAQDAANELINRGISREDISMVVRDASDTSVRQHEVGEENPMSSGAVSDSVVGGAVGLLVGAGLLAIPGIGPVLAIGPLAAAIGTIGAVAGSTALGAGIGAGVGGLAGALMGHGVPEESAHIYAEGVRRGGVLLTVSIDSTMDERVNVDAVLHHYGVVDINQRSKDWHKTDWNPSLVTGTVPSDFAQGQHFTPSSTAHPSQHAALPSTDPSDLTRSTYSTNNDRDFQTHYQSVLAASGRSYSDYVPAYIFGTDMATDSRVRGDTWDSVEPALHRNWDLSHPNTWDEFKTAVRYAWEKAHEKH